MSSPGPFAALPPQVDLPALEQEILRRWEADKVFARTLEGSAGKPQWVFYEGPPTANGRPGTHHIEARAFKDVFPRFKTMQGWHVPRRAGWDCHGLPVEIAVEQELGFAGKPDIERYGIAEFNARCRESVERHVGDVLRADPPDGLLGRHVHGLLDDEPELHRERLVVAQADLRQGPAGRGPPRRALLPALRHRAVRPRGRPGLRDPHRPVGLRAPAGHQRRVGRQGRPAGLDDDAVDAAVEHRRRDAPRRHLRRRPPRRHRRRARRGRRAAARPPSWARTPRCSPARPGRDWERVHLPAAVRAGRLPGRQRALRRPRRLRHHRGRHRAGAPVPRLRRRRPRRHPRLRHGRGQPDRPDRALPARRAAGRRALLQGRRRRAGRGPEEARRAVPGAALRAQLSALLALPHAAHVLRAAVLVHPHQSEIKDQLLAENEKTNWYPENIKTRPLRRLAEQQRRLGAVARPLLGHAAADLAQRRRPAAGWSPSARWPSCRS